MGNRVGQLVLGVVGGLVGATFGYPALGFSIGSAIGGFVFAPDGPSTEGPRIGDTDVQFSSLGKTVAEHYGVVRTGGNVIWATGLRETKKVETHGGGKGGGGESTSTQYEYFGNVLISFGYGPLVGVRRIWADSKLIYDATGEAEDVQNDEYSFLVRNGDVVQNVPGLVKESINRRLAGLDDVNAGNQEQTPYKTIDDLITDMAGSGDPRQAIYATNAAARKAEVEVGEGVPDYRFCPDYHRHAMIMFRNMPLVNFGNRIPNITAELVFGLDFEDYANTDSRFGASTVPLTEIAVDKTEPDGFWGLNRDTRQLFTISGGTLRKFSWAQKAETSNVVTTAVSGAKVLGISPTGSVVAHVPNDTSGRNFEVYNPGSLTTMYPIESTAAAAVKQSDYHAAFDAALGTPNYITPVVNEVTGSRSDMVLVQNTAGDVKLVDLNGAGPRILDTIDLGGTGPMIFAQGKNSIGTYFSAVVNGSNLSLVEIRTTSQATNGMRNTFSSSSPNPSPTLSVDSFQITAEIADTVALLAGETVSAILYDQRQDRVIVLTRRSAEDDGRLFIWQLPDLEDRYNLNLFSFPDTIISSGRLSLDTVLEVQGTLPLAPPPVDSGLSRSYTTGGSMWYLSGTSLVKIGLGDGVSDVTEDVVDIAASTSNQLFMENFSAIMTYISGEPVIVYTDRAIADSGLTLRGVVQAVCERAGMAADEFDVSGISLDNIVSGYSIGRPSTGRASLQPLLHANFVEGIESDWVIKFKDQSSDPIITIPEADLGRDSGETGDTNWIETRVPEYDLPAEISLIFKDINNDHQQGGIQRRRPRNPVSTMDSRSTENTEYPIVMSEAEAALLAERMLYSAWLARDTSVGVLPWKYISLDPGDSISVSFEDGRTVTDRLTKVDFGANFDISISGHRSGDPVYTEGQVSSAISANPPQQRIRSAANSYLFVLDLPLLEDFHSTGGSGSRYYWTVGADQDTWSGAAYYQSLDGNSYTQTDTISVDPSWGYIIGNVEEPRSAFATDTDTEITVSLSTDNGDIVTITDEQLLNTRMNRAAIHNPTSGITEIVQFRDVTVNADGTVTLSTFLRGQRGSEWAITRHTPGAVFIILDDSYLKSEINDIALVGVTNYFKAVSTGQFVNAAPPVTVTFAGNDLKPWGPSNVERSDDGTDLTLTWNRRARIGGAWNFTTNVEELPLVEEFEQYEVYIIEESETAFADFSPTDPSSYVITKTVDAATSVTITAAELSAASLTLSDTFFVVVYQISGTVGRGFPSETRLAP